MSHESPSAGRVQPTNSSSRRPPHEQARQEISLLLWRISTSQTTSQIDFALRQRRKHSLQQQQQQQHQSIGEGISSEGEGNSSDNVERRVCRIQQEVFRMVYDFAIYDSEEITGENPDQKYKKLYFLDLYYQLMT